MMKIGYIKKPENYDTGRYERWEDIEFLTEEQYDQKDRWAAMSYQRIIYDLIEE